MATGGKDRGARAERERARLYQARKAYHEGLERRRRRDNVIAVVAGGLLIAGITAGQVAYFTVGPGLPEPEPTETSTPAPSETTPPATPTPTATPAPESSTPSGETGAPTPSATDE